jgi:hypothetical protein
MEEEGTHQLSAVVWAQHHSPGSDEESFDFEAADASSDDSEGQSEVVIVSPALSMTCSMTY